MGVPWLGQTSGCEGGRGEAGQGGAPMLWASRGAGRALTFYRNGGSFLYDGTVPLTGPQPQARNLPAASHIFIFFNP